MTVDVVDVEERLRADLPRLADRLLAPGADDLAPEPTPLRDSASPRSPRARLLVGAGAIVLVVALAVGVTALVRRDPSVSTPSASGSSLAIDGPRPWPSASDPPPLTPRTSPAMAWLGNQLFVWAGMGNGAVNDGASFHVSRFEWTAMPSGGPGGPVMGTATDCYSGATAGQVRACESTHAQYVVGLIKNQGARLDPGSRTWTALPRLSDDAAVFRAVTSVRGVVFALVGTERAGKRVLQIARLGSDDRWHLGPTTRLGVLSGEGERSRHHDLTVDRGSLALWSDGVRVALYDIEGRSWHDGDDLSIPEGFGHPQVVGRDNRLVVIERAGDRAPAVYDRKSGRWVRLPGARAVLGGSGTSAMSSGDGVIVWDGRDRLWSWSVWRTGR